MCFKMRIKKTKQKKKTKKDVPSEAGSLFLEAAATMQDHIKQ